MKKSLAAVFALAAIAAMADASVTSIAARQRWPWSSAVDVDFWLDSETSADVLFSFTYSGASGSQNIVNGGLDSTVYGATPGANHFVWYPEDYGLDDQSLVNFSLSAVSINSTSNRTFLVLDLENATYEFMASRPSDELGWTNSTYKTSKIAFRRVPAGTYTVGHTQAEAALLNGKALSAVQLSSITQRVVKISSDYYIAIFPLTSGQQAYVSDGSTSAKASTGIFSKCSYDGFRGMTNADSSVNVNWPATGLGTFGTDTSLSYWKSKFSDLNIDLPTETQWEIAMRAGTTTIYPNGGTSANTTEELEALWEEFAPNNTAEAIGLRSPNAWDIYNPLGMQWYWCLDAVTPASETTSLENNSWAGQYGRDPVGETISVGSPMMRIARGGGYANASMLNSMPGARRAYKSNQAQCSVRLAVHLVSPIKR